MKKKLVFRKNAPNPSAPAVFGLPDRQRPHIQPLGVGGEPVQARALRQKTGRSRRQNCHRVARQNSGEAGGRAENRREQEKRPELLPELPGVREPAARPEDGGAGDVPARPQVQGGRVELRVSRAGVVRVDVR